MDDKQIREINRKLDRIIQNQKVMMVILAILLLIGIYFFVFLSAIMI